MDVSAREAPRKIADVLVQHRLYADVLINNAGVGFGGRFDILDEVPLAGFMPGPWQALYFAAKAFVVSFSEAIAEECRGSGVHVMVAASGPVETRIHGAMRTRWTWYRKLFQSYEPDDCAELIWQGFLAGHRVFVPGLFSIILPLSVVVSCRMYCLRLSSPGLSVRVCVAVAQPTERAVPFGNRL